MEDINLHFTGDIHMVTAAHNLLSAMIDNHIFHGNELNLDPDRIVWRRCMDMNDRALRDITVRYGNIARKEAFDITAASEVMAILCLATDITDMKKRFGQIIIGYSRDGAVIRASDLKAEGAMALLLKEALKPNLVQSIEGVPAFVHGGPFANIAHGCNSIISTRIALKVSDYMVTEAGFGADLGAEKFFDIKCRLAGLKPDLAVVAVTCRALKRQGGQPKEDLTKISVKALKNGLPNLEKHINNLKLYRVPIMVTINLRPEDAKEEVSAILEYCKTMGVEACVSDLYRKGGKGGIELARAVVKACRTNTKFAPLYPLDTSVRDKIWSISSAIYGADGVEYSNEALADLVRIEKSGYGGLPICMAKTQFSLSDDSSLLGVPRGFKLHVKTLKVSAGAGFIVAFTGDIMTMPGLPKRPAAERMDIQANGRIKGLF